MAIQQPPQRDATVDEMDGLKRLEASLLEQLRELKSKPTRDPSRPSVAQIEQELIVIHGRKSVLRTRRARG